MTASIYASHRSLARPSAHRVAHVPARLSVPTPSTFRRRRAVAAVFVATLVLSIGSLAQQGLADRGGAASVPTVGRTNYVVQPGDTLWGIATRLYPGADLPLVVDAMVTLNGGASIQAGQQLQLP